MFRSIVALIDPAGDPEGCARAAGDLAERTGGRLTFFATVPHVRTFSPVFWAVTLAPPATPTSLQHACECECEALLRRVTACVPAGIPVTMSVRHGRPYASLLRELKTADHDLVILDASRAGGLRRAAQRRFSWQCEVPVVRLFATSRPDRRRRGTSPRVLESVGGGLPAPLRGGRRRAA